MVNILTRTISAHVEAASRGYAERLQTIKTELLGLECGAANLVAFLKAGGQSPAVLAELETTETTINVLRAELAEGSGETEQGGLLHVLRGKR